jgi:glycosyltransferase involved in cell wall biosynthesis
MKEPGFSELGWYNSGVILWRRNEATDRLFETWGREWSRFGRIDQGALARALKSSAPALHALSSIWNSTPNRFASIKAARRAGVRILHFLSKQRPLLSRFIAADEQDAEPAPRGTALQVQEPTARRPLRALWITSTLFPRIGGIETYVEKAVGSLCAHCDVGLVTRRGQWLRDGSPITHFVLSGPVGGANAEAWRSMADGLQRLIDRFEPDVVHFANARSASCRAIVPSEVATVATVHGNDLTNLRPEDREEDPTPYIVESLNACDKVLTCSDYASNLAREWGVRTPIDTITPGCDLEFYRPRPALGRAARGRLKIPQDAPMILTVSRLVPRKGHLTVLEAIRRLPFPAYWVVAGAGPCKGEIIAAVRENGLADQVRMLGAVSDETLLGLYNACDLFVLTPESQRLGPWLDSEGFGLVLQEASACGKPVISSTSGGCQDAVIDGGTGLLTPPGDPERLSEAMGAILTDADFARSLGEGGLQLVRMSGGWPRLARQTFEAYEDLLDRRRVAHAL